MISIKSKLLLASTALVAVAGVASAADTTIAPGGLGGDDAASFAITTDANSDGNIDAGDVVSTSGAIADLDAGNSIDVSTTGATVNFGHNVTGNAAAAAPLVDVTGANNTITVAAGVTLDPTQNHADADAIVLTGAGNTVNVAGTLTSGVLGNSIEVAADVASTINVQDGGTVGTINADAATSAATTLTVAGTAGNISANGGGAVTATVTGTAGTLTTGAGDDSVTVSTASGNLGNTDLDAGANTVNVETGATIGTITATTGVDTVTVAGTAGNTDLGAGNNVVTVSGTMGTLTTDAGDDTLTVTGTVGNTDLGEGANTVTVTAATVGTLTGGTAVDTLTVSGAKSTIGAIDLEGDADVVNLSSTVATTAASGDATTIASIETGAGIDDINVTSGFINLTGNLVNTGADVDTLDISNGAKLRVAGTSATGTLTVAEGGIFHAVGATTLVGDATINGTYIADTDTTATAQDITVGSTGKATLNGTSAATNLNVAGEATIATGTTTISGASDITGKVYVKSVDGGTGASFVAGTLTDVDTKISNITLELNDDAGESGTLTTASNVDLNNGTVALAAAQGVALAADATTGVDHAGLITAAAAADIDGSTLSQGNAIYDYTWTKGSATTYDLNVKLKNAGVTTLAAAVSENKGLAAELERTAGGNLATNTADLYKEVFKQSDTKKTLETLTSDVSGGLTTASFDAAKGVAKSVETRLASLRGQSGIAAGDMQSNGAMWVKAFGSTANQDAKTGTSGYDADTLGLAYGIDSDNIVKGATVGLALSYAGSEVDSEAGSETDVSSYQLTAYASKDLGNRAYVDAQVGVAYNEFETDRTDFLGDKYSADFEGWQYSAAVEAGRSFDYMGATVTPKAGLQYITQNMDSYDETGSGANGLSVDNEDVSALYARVGADVAWNISTASGTNLKPYVSAAISHDLIADEMEARTSFLAGGNAFTVDGADVEETALEIGTGIEIMSVSGVDLTFAYDGVFKEDFDSHAGSIKARWAF